MGRVGLPRAIDRQAGWASTWRPGPAEEVARDGGMRARGVVTACSPCVGRRGGALAGGPMAASPWQGAAGELAGATRRTPGKAVRGGAHLNSGAAWRQWRCLGQRHSPAMVERQRPGTLIGGPAAGGGQGKVRGGGNLGGEPREAELTARTR
jgi:hypothetical protein